MLSFVRLVHQQLVSWFHCLFFTRKHRWKTNAYLDTPYYRRSRTSSLLKNLSKTYRTLQDGVLVIFRLFIFIDQITRAVFNFVNNLNRIVCAVYGWIQMLRSVCSALHLIASRLMILSSAVYRIFHLLAILLEPLSNRSMEKAGRAFSHWLFDYYSSNGACYTLKARTHHIVRRVRARWRKNPNSIDDDDVYYDALDEEHGWF